MVLFAAWPVSAGEDSDDTLPPWADLAGPPDPASRVIQKRRFELNHEIALMIGELPASPFYKGITLNAGYTLHFSNYVAWQILNFTYSIDVDTDLKRELQQIITLTGNTGKTAPYTGEIIAYGASHLIIKPFYGKQALRQSALLHVEGYLGLGPALAVVQRTADNGVAFGGEWLVGLRLWFSPVVSSRLEIGQLIYLVEGQVLQALHARIGIGFNFGGEE